MVSVATLVGLGVIVVLHTVMAAVGARFFRLQMKTRWGAVIYTVLLVPLAYVPTTIVLGGVLGLGGGLFSDQSALVYIWALPFFLGYSIDLFWMPPPEEADLSRRAEQ
ncbi:hypothetical protein ACFQH6_17220 [Halobacteriaceae archaeon GCM10025711]